MAKIACFLALLKVLRSHNTCNQGNKYMEMCRAILCINMCNVFYKGVTGKKLSRFNHQISRLFQSFNGF